MKNRKKTNAGALHLKNILVPIDFSGNAQKALRYAIPLAAQSGARISMLHVIARTVYPTEMGGVVTSEIQGPETNYGLLPPGKIIHEVGTIRMGDDPKKSALNKYCQAHDCKNLFCVDGGQFVSQGDKNITWSILALSMRASEHIVDELKKNNL